MSKKCQDCKYLSKYYEFNDKQYIQCYLTNTILTDNAEEMCDCHDINLDGIDICFNCRYFGGGGDWGLACRKHYHALPKATDRMCKDGEFKDDTKVDGTSRSVSIDITKGE